MTVWDAGICHWAIDQSLGCCDLSLSHWSKSGMLWSVTDPLIKVWDAVISYCQSWLSGMLWSITEPMIKIIKVWNAVPQICNWTFLPSLGCCDQSLNHWSKSGMLWSITEPLMNLGSCQGCCDQSLIHWSKSGSTLGCCDPLLIYSSKSGISHWTLDPSLVPLRWNIFVLGCCASIVECSKHCLNICEKNATQGNNESMRKFTCKEIRALQNPWGLSWTKNAMLSFF